MEGFMNLLEEKINKLPDDLKKEALDFIDFLIEKKLGEKPQGKRPSGLAKGSFFMSEDFNQPLTEEELKKLGFE